MKTGAVGPGAAPQPQAAGAARDAAKTAAKQLEAFFLRQLLSEARPQGGGMLDGGFAGDTFKQMLDEAIADKMSAAGGVGMASLFAKQLGGASEIAGAPPAPAIARASHPLPIAGSSHPLPIAGAQPTAAIASASHPVAGAAPAIASASHPIAGAAPTIAGSLSGQPIHDATTVTRITRVTYPAPGNHAAAALSAAPSTEAPRFVLPVTGRPSSGYGLRTDPIHGGTVNHTGFDLAAAAGTEVAAAARGTVVHAGPAGTYGNLVTLRHDDGFETRYAHLSEVDVKVGEVVESGAEIGKVGSTGRSTGPHLHFEVRQDGKSIDPAPLLPLNSSASRTTR